MSPITKFPLNIDVPASDSSQESIDPCGTDIASVEQPDAGVWKIYSATLRFAKSQPLTDDEISSYIDWLVAHSRIRSACVVVEMDFTASRHIQSHFEVYQNNDDSRAHNFAKQIKNALPSRPLSTCSKNGDIGVGYHINPVRRKGKDSLTREQAYGYDLKDFEIPDIDWETLSSPDHTVFGMVNPPLGRAFFMGNRMNNLYLETCKLAWTNSDANQKRIERKRKHGEIFLAKTTWPRQLANYNKDEFGEQGDVSNFGNAVLDVFSDKELDDMDSCTKLLVHMLPDKRVEFGMLCPTSRAHITSMRLDDAYPKDKIKKLIKKNGTMFS